MRVRTQLAGLVSVAVVVAVLLFFTAPFEVLPKATLGAVIIVAAIGLIEPSAWKALREAGGSQVLIAVVTFAGSWSSGSSRRSWSRSPCRSSTSRCGARSPTTPCSDTRSASGAGRT